MTTLAAAIVSYFSDTQLLTATVEGLARAARASGIPVRLVLVDNSANDCEAERLGKLVEAWQQVSSPARVLKISLLRTKANLGYGAGNNAAFADADEDFVLVLNPDAVLAPDAISNAIATLEWHPECALLAPRAMDGQGRDLYLGHGYPAVLALAGRSMAWLQRFQAVRRSMANYELKQLDSRVLHEHIVCASGCFMFLRRATWQASGGFDPSFFLYFEDYDLSIRVRKHGKIIYQPEVRITHLGGDASGKGWYHTRLFVVSALRFFVRHGFRWA